MVTNTPGYGQLRKSVHDLQSRCDKSSLLVNRQVQTVCGHQKHSRDPAAFLSPHFFITEETTGICTRAFYFHHPLFPSTLILHQIHAPQSSNLSQEHQDLWHSCRNFKRDSVVARVSAVQQNSAWFGVSWCTSKTFLQQQFSQTPVCLGITQGHC